MKVIDGTLSAIWCAATEAVPNVPMISVAVLNSIASNSMVNPMGMPRRNTS